MSNVKIILLGDATEGLKYAPTAMWYAKKMRIDGLRHGMSRVLPIAEGVTLRVNLDDNTGDKAYIDAGNVCRGWYMDSGLTDLVAAAPKHPQRGVPGLLLKGDALRLNKMWGDISPSVFEHTPATPQAEGDPVGALTANYPPVPVGDGILPPTPLSPNATQAELQTWVDAATPDQLSAWVLAVSNTALTTWHQSYEAGRDALSVKKRAVRDVPSSLFHGKLRLWVQAIYGKKFSIADWTTKYTMVGKLAPSMTIKLPTTTNPNRAYTLNSNTTVLYTDDELNYWLIEIPAETGVTIRQLKLSLCGNIARDHLLTAVGKALSREEKARFEAVMLQTAEPDMANSFVVPTGISAASRGVTLCYGWKANWGGSKADIVLHAARQGPTSADADVYFDASHLSLAFKRDTKKVLVEGETEKDRWTVTSSDTGFKKWMVTVTQHNIWVPDFDTAGTGVLRVFPPMECGVSRVAPTPISSTAPLYCFYDKDAAFRLISYTQNIVAGHTDTILPRNGVSISDVWNIPPVTGTNNFGSTEVFAAHTTGSFISSESVAAETGSTSISETYMGVAEPFEPGTYTDQFVYCVPVPYSPQTRNYYPYSVGEANPTKQIARGFALAFDAGYEFMFADNYSRTATRVKSGQVTLVVPYGDSCAVYLGKSQSFIETDVSRSTGRYGVDLGAGYSEVDGTRIIGRTFIYSLTSTVRETCGSVGSYVDRNQYSYALGYPYTPPTITISDITPNRVSSGVVANTVSMTFRFLGYGGVHDADPAFFNKPNDNPSGAMFDPGTIMSPQRYKPTNTSAEQFYTISSAVHGDTIGKTFTTGGYIIHPGDSILKGFIGFS